MKNLISTLALVSLIACDSSVVPVVQDTSPVLPVATSTPVAVETSVATSDSTTLNTVASPTPSPSVSIQATPVASTSPSPTPSITSTASPTPSASPTPTPTNFAYVINKNDNTVSQYSISPVDGSLSVLAQPLATGTNPTDLLMDSTKQNVYVLNSGSQTVSHYSIQSDGTLKAVSSAPAISSSYTLQYMSWGIDNKLYVNLGSNNANQYTVDTGSVKFASLIYPYAGYLNLKFTGHTSATLNSVTYTVTYTTNTVDSVKGKIATGNYPTAIVIK